jgi:hypothetical protein
MWTMPYKLSGQFHALTAFSPRRIFTNYSNVLFSSWLFIHILLNKSDQTVFNIVTCMGD